jgi:hypothetical protein
MKKKNVATPKKANPKAIVKPDYSQMELSMIIARLALPMEKRTGFLRRRLPNGGSSL